MIIYGIDPGPTASGVAVYDTQARRLLHSNKAASLGEVRLEMQLLNLKHQDLWVAIERMQSYGIAGGSLLQTSEIVGRVQEMAHTLEIPHSLHYRREVLRALDVTGKGNRDSLVMNRLIEMHGGTKRAAVGLKKEPGPLYGISSHAWAALAVAITAGLGAGGPLY